MQPLSVIRTVLCWGLFLLGLLFAGYANERVKSALTDLDRVILLVGFIVGVGAIVRWLAQRSFWFGQGVDEVE